jgi:hypothetical protein
MNKDKDLNMNKYQLWNRIETLINQHINDKQISEQLLGLIDDYGIESYGEGSDQAEQPEFY